MTAGDKRKLVAVEHESDLCLGYIYSHLVLEICYERLINSVTVNAFRHSKSSPKKGGSTNKKVKSHTSHSSITAEYLTRKMNIGLEKSKQIMIATTQKVIQTAVHPITRRYKVDHLDLYTARLVGKYFVDWISAGTKLLSHNAVDFMFSNITFTKVYPSDSKQQMPENMYLNDF